MSGAVERSLSQRPQDQQVEHALQHVSLLLSPFFFLPLFCMDHLSFFDRAEGKS